MRTPEQTKNIIRALFTLRDAHLAPRDRFGNVPSAEALAQARAVLEGVSGLQLAEFFLEQPAKARDAFLV